MNKKVYLVQDEVYPIQYEIHNHYILVIYKEKEYYLPPLSTLLNLPSLAYIVQRLFKYTRSTCILLFKVTNTHGIKGKVNINKLVTSQQLNSIHKMQVDCIH